MSELLSIIKEYPNAIVALTAVIAVFMSFISIILTFFSLRMQRNYIFKSVTPIGNFSFSDYENLISVKLVNAGIGPLIINRFTAIKENGSMSKSIIELMPSLPRGLYWSTYFVNPEGFAILPSKSINLLEFKGNMDDPAFCKARNMAREHLSKIELRLVYSDLYEREMPEIKESMVWFSRHIREDNSNMNPPPKKSSN